ncbi:MAG: biofilm PGA synthesis N-glycosyltransferase PgaC [Cyclobacteriaceae bacterium]|jgi:cellulose synthase/poly-beta-1,6-N-acetylglucosamine synthase-like glycosyltransferase
MIIEIAIVFHVVFFVFLNLYWKKMPFLNKRSASEKAIDISLLIAVRNEEWRIRPLLASIAAIEFDGNWQVIFIDDNSTDKTEQIIKDFFLGNDLINFSLIKSNGQGKKAALSEGVDQASYNYIVTIDADCTFQEVILKEYARLFSLDVEFIAGPVRMKSSNFFEKIQAVEFAGLTSAGAVLLEAGKPIYCNGANMGYKKATFKQLEGYAGNEHIPSGDDQFLLHKMVEKFPDKLAYLKSREAMVSTGAEASFRKLINQRIRWSSKWKNFKSIKMILSSFLFFVAFSSVPIIAFLAIRGNISFQLAFTFILSKFLVEWLLIERVSSYFGLKKFTLAVLCLQIIYPFFIIFLAIASTFGRYSWKGRNYDR